jgi:hypothetical protein
MVPHGGAARRRLLLPAEAELCNALGLSEAEYWYFVDLTDSYNGKRAEEYELAGVPEVENAFIVPILISLVIGIAISAVGMLLAPKPRSPEAQQAQDNNAGNLKTADKTGAKRFSPSSSFDSVQNLASLGETIPLVFANRRSGVGGIRMNALLLWSQLLSYGNGQQLKALLVLSAGQLAEDPEFAGMAIGDQTLKNYTAAKVGLYRRLSGGRIQEGDRYADGTIEANPFGDVFTVYDDGSESYKQWFCGTRSTSTQTQFGVFSPMVNATAYRPAYELVMNPRSTDDKIKGDNNIKREKLNRAWRTLAGLESLGGVLHYHIHGGMEPADAYPPWGLTDINSATEARRIQADDSLQIGSLYMAGTAHVVCTAASTLEPWVPGMDKYYSFKIEQPGTIRYVDISSETLPPHDLILQRLAIGTVSNNRACHVTEIGIKSNVWKQISGFSNVNSQPSAGVIADYENRNGNIQLGQIQSYVTRYSFFRLETRKLGSTDGWLDITNGALFCVKGSSPQDRYNFIRVVQPYGQQEYRFVPVPGAEIVRAWIFQYVYVLNPGALTRYQAGAFTVTFCGQPERLTPERMTNTEWSVGSTPPSSSAGSLYDTSPNNAGGARPTYQSWVLAEERFDDYNRWVWLYDEYGNLYGEHGLWDSAVVSPGEEFRPRGDGGIQRWEWRNVEESPIADGYVNVSAAEGSGGVLYVQQWSNGYVAWSVAASGSGYLPWQPVTFSAFGGTYSATGLTDENRNLASSLNLYDAIADIGMYDAERFSHEDNPEHAIVYVNEIVRQDGAIPQYDRLALLGLRLNATKEWSSFNQLSAYIKRGVIVERLIDDAGQPTTGLRGPTNNFAEIAYALLTDAQIGAGKILGAASVNRDRMTLAAQFCHANGFTWDGVIAERLNLRNWIFEQAAYCLLDFTILGGQFSLVPSVPYSGDFKIDNAAKPVISALFTDGNVRNLKVSWLSPEERQLFKGVVKWRQETENGFSQERTLSVRFTDVQGGNDHDPEETFDLSGFCTDQRQAQAFVMFALGLRKVVDHGLTFETTPQSAMGLEPGQYFRLVSEVTHTSRFNNGSINSEGFITSTTTLADGNYDILCWKPGTVGVGEAVLGVKDGKALQPGLFGQVFTIKTSVTTSRVYKVESLSFSPEGFVEIAGSAQPLTPTGSLSTLDWQADHFLIEAF